MKSLYVLLGLTLSILHLDWLLPLSPNFKVKQHIDFEDAKVTSNSITSNGYTLPTHESSENIWGESEIVKKGKKSLGFTLYPHDGRREILIADIPNNTRKFIAFSVYFPKDYEIPTNWNLFAQWWQGSPASPPIAFEVTPNSDQLKMRILTRSGLYAQNNIKIQYEQLLPKEKWIDFVIEMEIDDTGNNKGILNVWENNIQIVKYKGPLGYTDLYSHTNFRVGLYRWPHIMSKSTVYFDEIKIGDRN